MNTNGDKRIVKYGENENIIIKKTFNEYDRRDYLTTQKPPFKHRNNISMFI